MAELASVKVALLDIGKEQRIKKGRGKKSDEAPGPAGSKRQMPSPAVMETCILMPTPSLHILTLSEHPAGS